MKDKARSLASRGAAGVAVLVLAGISAASGQTPAPAAAPAPLAPQQVLLGSLELLVPKDFVKMPPDVAKKTYAADRMPNVAFMSPDAAVTIGISHSLSRVSAAEIPQSRASSVTQLKTTYPKAEWVKEASNPIGRGGGYLLDIKINQGTTQGKRMMIVGTSLAGRLATIVLSAPLKDEAKWAPVFEQIVKSIKPL
ncbi:MAG TPA: hypothetical protein VHR17_06905 [Thermoanaerobaculia bacterium]|jgi:hypothetical protein|nr:hypothetical protein [Thermoanaerobaculia bacterium]